MGRTARWMPVLVTTGVAAALTGAAVVTADQAGCDDPGRYVVSPAGVELVGGCLRPDDLPVAPPPAEQSPQPRPLPLGD